jgi:UDP-N-acetylglucosamine 1-carboxyvinyltransferase
MARLLLDLGAEVDGIGSPTLTIRCQTIRTHEPDRALVGRLRGSVLLLGPLLARTGRAYIAPPGGDFPARRTIRTHLEALVAMGAEPVDGPGHRLEAPRGLAPASIYLDEASVTGTETALLAAAAAPGISEIRHCACEPHVVELCEFLASMGAGITGAGSHTIRVEGSPRLGGATRRLWGDYIEAGSWAVVGAITGGEVEVRGARALDMEVVIATLRKRLGVRCQQRDEILTVEPSTLTGAGRITTGLWPAFPSDLVSLVTVLATQADGARWCTTGCTNCGSSRWSR